jgi:hypothetical protein
MYCYAVQWQTQIVGGDMRKVVEVGGPWWLAGGIVSGWWSFNLYQLRSRAGCLQT